VCGPKELGSWLILKLIDTSITNNELLDMSKKMFDGLVKAVVDIENEIMVVDAELHADQEDYLLKRGSKQDNLWGINIYPEEVESDNWLEFDSMINLRPSQNNKSRGIENEAIRAKVASVIEKLVIR
jgi:hypothetical protein